MFYLIFSSVYDPGHRFAFPCNKEGEVNLNEITESMKLSYYYCKTLVGREFTHPEIVENEYD